MTQRISHSGLAIDAQLYQFITEQVLPHTELDTERLFAGLADIIQRLTPINKALLAKRDSLQKHIDGYYQKNTKDNHDEYTQFLKDIGYLLEQPQQVSVETEGVDDEIARMAGPQLVVPVSNARFALNAANARWGSLYDALYGSDVISEEEGAEQGSQYNPVRGFKVMAYARQFLDKALPLKSGSHIESTEYAINNGELVVILGDSQQVTLAEPSQLIGYQGQPERPTALLFCHHGLHFIIAIDPHNRIGRDDKAGIKDIVLESALTTIMDCEDSVAAVDGEDKTQVYRNWFGLMMGNLSCEFSKGGQTQTRRLNKDQHFTKLDGSSLTLHGRSLMFVRNVGHLMTTPAILDSDDNEVFEGILDAVFTSLCALPEYHSRSELANSRTQSIYIVKPKMHGPEEVAFTAQLFSEVEVLLDLPNNTLKMGIMDEERRTSVNLKACIAQAKQRVVFINTGFLDRTGDEIHTAMEAGAALPKSAIKAQPWIDAYEKRNVSIGLECGLSGKAQIGKGMWPMPDKLALMMEQKIGHVKSGANTAWVPSPTAATLHALHYHDVDVFAQQKTLSAQSQQSFRDLLTPPIDNQQQLSSEDIQLELDNNVQGILGYVVRWVEQGVGCSKVPDINNVGLMEDRATLRISSQHIANWLHHGICTEEQVLKTMKRMAKVVDEQNAGDSQYKNMADSEQSLLDSLAFQAATDLVFKGRSQPNGYTEPLLHHYRRLFKERQASM
ncbi:malate synthase G [Pseudoalteromonas ruthenica]|uniref:malate synthase G n=1 Tax=Pseudoalteromonas ruthenica TaxID=151081 RepID=UPI001108467E|nr:malate synthase G [Pseudoalteromonas ruthenica]TLX51768.1 malate synthase G [Pseudoalteromonas ruthenica]